jgi:hypothetical protein
MHEHLEVGALLSEVAEVLHSHHVHVQRDIISTQVIKKISFKRGIRMTLFSTVRPWPEMAPVQEPARCSSSPVVAVSFSGCWTVTVCASLVLVFVFPIVGLCSLGFYPSWLQEKMVALPGDIIYGKAFDVISKKKIKG